MLSKGQEWDWLGDPFWRVQTLLILFVLGLGLLIVREMRTAHPIIDFRVLGERNFAVCCVIMFFAFAVVYCASIALPTLLQALFGYDALRLRAGDVPVRRLLDGRDGGRRHPAGPAV